MAALNPTVSYNWLRQDGAGVTGDGPELVSVMEVNAQVRDGHLDVWVRGCIRRKDGTPSRVQRSVRIDRNRAQPAWLVDIIEDAHERLPEGL